MKTAVCTDIQDRTGNVVAMAKDKLDAIAQAKKKRPNELLIGTTTYDDGSEDGFVVGPCPF